MIKPLIQGPKLCQPSPQGFVNPFYVTGSCFSDASPTQQNLIRQYSKNAILQPMSQSISLVVWGTNVQSTVEERFSHKELATIRLTPYTKGVIVGLILSDGWLIFGGSTSKIARLGFMQSYDHSKYLSFVFFMLSHYCSSYPIFIKRTRFGRVGYSLEFSTRLMPCLTELFYLFYPRPFSPLLIPPPGFPQFSSPNSNNPFSPLLCRLFSPSELPPAGFPLSSVDSFPPPLVVVY